MGREGFPKFYFLALPFSVSSCFCLLVLLMVDTLVAQKRKGLDFLNCFCLSVMEACFSKRVNDDISLWGCCGFCCGGAAGDVLVFV